MTKHFAMHVAPNKPPTISKNIPLISNSGKHYSTWGFKVNFKWKHCKHHDLLPQRLS